MGEHNIEELKVVAGIVCPQPLAEGDGDTGDVDTMDELVKGGFSTSVTLVFQGCEIINGSINLNGERPTLIMRDGEFDDQFNW